MRSRALALLVLAAASASAAHPAVSRLGSEFQVNSYTTSHQYSPDAAMASDGRFVIVWASDGQDGGMYGIFGRRFDSLGAPQGAEFQINTYTTSNQYQPAISMDGAGGFVVVWTSSNQDGSSLGIFGRRFDSAGSLLGSEFRVNTDTAAYQATADVAADTSGNFVVVWTSGTGDGSFAGVFGQRYDSSGTPAGSQFRVNSYTTGSQTLPSVTMDSTGAFVAAWQSQDQDGQSSGIFAQRYASTGLTAGSEFQVNTFTTGTQIYPSVAADSDGDFIVAWSSPKPAVFEIAAQRYDSSGLSAGSEFQVAAYAPYNQIQAAVATEDSGGFVAAWDEIVTDGSGHGIVGRRAGAGMPVSGDFLVNTYTTSDQGYPSLAMSDSGNLVVVWQSRGQDGSQYGIFGQRFSGRAPGLTSHMSGDVLDCSDPAVIRPTFTWEPDGYDKFRVYLGTNPAFSKGSYVTSGDALRPGTSWEPSAKKWRKACAKAIAADPINPAMFIRILGKDTDLGSGDPDRLRNSETVMTDVQP